MNDELTLRHVQATGLPVIIFEDDAITTMRNIDLLAWAALELNRQLAANRTCALCGKVAVAGVHTTCDHCGRPVCGVCAVQAADGHFCPTCPRELPF